MRIALVLLLAAACTQPRSERCKTVCAREYECITKTSSSMLFDEKECIAACSVLESDPDNLAKVIKHADCVAKHDLSCPDVLLCD